MSVKVLVCGPVHGKIEALLKRVATVNNKAGPFAAVLCVGAFFEDGDAGAPCPAWVKELAAGDKAPAVPIYFTGGDGVGAEEALLALEAAPQCGVRYLGPYRVGVVAGLRVAVFDSARTSGHQALIKELNAAEGDVDMLVTDEWPQGVLTGAAPVEGAPTGSEAAAELAQVARPRYHFAASGGVFHQRAPYMNRDLGAGAHATRFIGLAAVGNAGKAKWAHALQVQPAAQMSQAELCTRPEGCSESPYMLALGTKRPAGDQSWRWGDQGGARAKKARPEVAIDSSRSVFVRNLPFSATEDDLEAFFSKAGAVEAVRWKTQADGKRQGWGHVQFAAAAGVAAALELSGQSLMGRALEVHQADEATGGNEAARLNLGQPVKDCWFCLSNEEADVHLVVDVLDHAYVAVDKGPITDTHVLVISVEHYPNEVTLKPEAVADVARLREALRAAYASKGLELVGFERYLAFHARGGNHCHINFIGVPKDKAAKAAEFIKRAAFKHDIAFEAIPAGESAEAQAKVKELVGTRQYFQAFLPDGSRLVHTVQRGERHPLSFGREVLAELAGVPARADWKACKLPDATSEERKALELQEWFTPFLHKS